MSLLYWNDTLKIGLERMDATHREFVELYRRLAAGQEAVGFLAALDALIAHTEAHFEQENRWMEECGFPPIRIHAGEHARVQGLLREARSALAGGDAGPARRLVAELPDWFLGHAATMDAALAHHIRATGYDVQDGADKALA